MSMYKKLLLTTALALGVMGQLNSRMRATNITDIFSETNLRIYMEQIGILHIDIVMAQAKIESAHFSSTIFKENHNLFGMKLAKKRKTTAIGKNRSHAKYINWKQSVLDYKLWQDAYSGKYKSRRAYLKYLDSVYAEDGNYVRLIKKMI